jgi:hypothetical protein
MARTAPFENVKWGPFNDLISFFSARPSIRNDAGKRLLSANANVIRQSCDELWQQINWRNITLVDNLVSRIQWFNGMRNNVGQTTRPIILYSKSPRLFELFGLRHSSTRLLRPSAGRSGQADRRHIRSFTWATACHATGKWRRLGRRSGIIDSDCIWRISQFHILCCLDWCRCQQSRLSLGFLAD